MAVHRLLGQILMELGLLTKTELNDALAEQSEGGAQERIGKILLRRGCLTPEELAQALAQQLHISYRGDVSGGIVSEEALALVPQHFAQRHAVMPLARKEGKLILAMADPTDFCAMADVKTISGLGIERVSTTAKEIEQAIRVAYGKRQRVERGAAPLEYPMAAEASAIEIVDMLIDHAVREKASDIHIEPQASAVRVRFRIDGVLRQFFSFSPQAHPALVSRIKIMSALDIAEKRVPQDGRMSCAVQGRMIDLRVSSIPTILGEKIVLRLLDDQSAGIAEVAHLGLSEMNLALFERMYRRPCGILLAVGPTGSGKSTSLYAVLNALNSVERNIVTIEDPVEYRLDGVSQMQVHPKAGLTFARGLRSVLRQDPNVIMVGEIRDAETAKIAVKAALTGHFVLSTLHTNDAVGAVERLLDMGVEPFLVASSLTGVLAQRLVRRICPHCRETYTAPREAIADVFYQSGGAAEFILYRGRGCVKCSGTGYQGRLAIHEVMPILAPMREMIRRGGARKAIEDAAVAAGMRRMAEDGMQKVLRGETTVEEVRRVVYADAEGNGWR